VVPGRAACEQPEKRKRARSAAGGRVSAHTTGERKRKGRPARQPRFGGPAAVGGKERGGEVFDISAVVASISLNNKQEGAACPPAERRKKKEENLLAAAPRCRSCRQKGREKSAARQQRGEEGESPCWLHILPERKRNGRSRAPPGSAARKRKTGGCSPQAFLIPGDKKEREAGIPSRWEKKKKGPEVRTRVHAPG